MIRPEHRALTLAELKVLAQDRSIELNDICAAIDEKQAQQIRDAFAALGKAA